jgi:glycosyltransferase involved in cell wall biosynthesis
VIEALYREADVFVLPSRLETWGDVLLEAMAFGLPCLGVAGEAMDEIIVDGVTGAIVPPNDVEALAEQLTRLLCDRDRARSWGLAGRQRVEAEFTWARVVARLAIVIRAVLI